METRDILNTNSQNDTEQFIPLDVDGKLLTFFEKIKLFFHKLWDSIVEIFYENRYDIFNYIINLVKEAEINPDLKTDDEKFNFVKKQITLDGLEFAESNLNLLIEEAVDEVKSKG